MFRRSILADCESIYKLICQLENTVLPYEGFEKTYFEQLHSGKYISLVYESEGAVKAFINVRCENQLHHAGKIAEIMEFIVSPECRHSGLGAKMFGEAARLAKEEGCSQIEVACNQLRRDTHRFYERAGMNNFHFKFSMPLDGSEIKGNAIGR